MALAASRQWKNLVASLLVLLPAAPALAQVRHISPKTPLFAAQVCTSSANSSLIVGLDSRGPFGPSDQVLLSNDGGLTFDHVGVPGVDSLYGVGLDAGGVIYAFGEQAVHASDNGGATWTRRPTPFGDQGARALVPGEHQNQLWVSAEAPNDPLRVAFWRSRDGGRSWLLTGTHDRFSRIFDVDGTDPEVAVSNMSILSVTRDGGLTWTATPTCPDVGAPSDGAVSGGVLFVSGNTSDDLLVSLDGGQTWNSGVRAAGRFLLDVDPARPQHIVAADQQGELHESWDQGTTWVRRSEEGDGWQPSSLAIHGAAGAKLCLASKAGDVATSDPSGGSMVISVMDSDGGGRFAVEQLYFDPQDRRHLVGRFGTQLTESFDAGASCSVLPAPTRVTSKVAAFGPAGAFYVGGLGEDGGPTLHRRAGADWDELSVPSNNPFIEEVNDIAVSPVDPATVVLALAELSLNNPIQIQTSRLLVSTDAGASWTPRMVGSATDPERLENLQFIGGTQPQRLVMSARRDDGQVRFASVRRTDDLGASHVEVFSGVRPFELAVSRNLGGRVISGEAFGNSQIRSSFDGLESFTQATPARTNGDLAIGTDYPRLYARRVSNVQGASFVFLSRDAGATWDQVPGLGLVPRLFDLLFSPGDEELIVLAGMEMGIVGYVLAQPLGTEVCGPAVPNVAGRPGRLSGFGSDSVLASDARLLVSQLPPHATALLIGSTQLDVIPGAGGSFGTLCLGGSIGRDLGSLGGVSARGERTYSLDLSALPGASSPVAAQAGATWGFQIWHRDRRNGIPGSNFTNALAVQWQP